MTKNLDNEGLSSIADNYQLFYIDLWGVIHNGINLHNEAINTLEQISKKDKALLSVPKIVSLDSGAIEPREREQEIVIDLTNTAGGYNNEILELKFEQLQEGIQTPIPYQTREIKLLQPFGNDFEDF